VVTDREGDDGRELPEEVELAQNRKGRGGGCVLAMIILE
jgi:hypothetical protein